MAVVDQTPINLGELKFRIAKTIGPDRTRLYFSHLNRLLAQKLNKFEFKNLCLKTLGDENIQLHNELIRSILKNAYNAKAPPPLPSKPVGVVVKKSLQEAEWPHPTKTPAIWSDGDLFTTHPRKIRSARGRNRRLKDGSSSLGPDGVAFRVEKGTSSPCDLKRRMQNHEGEAEQQPAKRPRMTSSLGIVFVEEEGEVVVEDQCGVFDLSSRRNPIQAPLGIPFCPPSAGGARRPLSALSTNSNDLMKRMEGIVRAQGLEGLSADSAKLLNNGLDSYLKQLIRSSFQLSASRSQREPTKNLVYEQRNSVDGVWQGNNPRVLTSNDRRKEQKMQSPVSLRDFKVAMELNPNQLGENWPFLLEKLCVRSFENQGRSNPDSF